MSEYLPFGEQLIPSKEKVQQQINKFKQYDFYGIQYGNFDTPEYNGEYNEGYSDGEGRYYSDKEKDIEEARTLILQGEPIPNDLEQRLLSYKKLRNSTNS